MPDFNPTIPALSDAEIAAAAFRVPVQTGALAADIKALPGSRLVTRAASGLASLPYGGGLSIGAPGATNVAVINYTFAGADTLKIDSGTVAGSETKISLVTRGPDGTTSYTFFIDNTGPGFLPAFRPGSDNVHALGTASSRWDVVYAATGSINTSDERDKVWRGGLSEAERAAARAIVADMGFFQWTAAVAEKGDGARLHFGVRAQAVWQIMAEHGLVDPIGDDGLPGNTPYAFLCFDAWEEESEPITKEVRRTETRRIMVPIEGMENAYASVEEETEVVEQIDTGERRVTREAGHRYGLRMDQLALFLIAGALS